MDIKAPQMQSLRDYLDAVSEILKKSGSSHEDIEQIHSSICEQVSNSLEKSSASQDEVESIVRGLAAPESYCQKTETTESPSATSASTKTIKPWVIWTGIGGLVALAMLVIIIVCTTLFISYRNKIVLSEKAVEAASAQVEVVLQRRFDLIPNLVKTVKGYAQHESAVFTEVTRLRSQWQASQNPKEKRGFAIEIEPQIGKLMAVAEQYPNLRASENFLTLQTQLESTENRIATERQRMNLAIRDYNSLIKLFPGNVVASVLSYVPKDLYYEANPEAHTAPEVNF